MNDILLIRNDVKFLESIKGCLKGVFQRKTWIRMLTYWASRSIEIDQDAWWYFQKERTPWHDFEGVQNRLVKEGVLLKVSSGVLIYLYRSWCPICKQLYPGLPLKNSFQTTLYAFQKFYTISDQQYVIHIYLSEML